MGDKAEKALELLFSSARRAPSENERSPKNDLELLAGVDQLKAAQLEILARVNRTIELVVRERLDASARAKLLQRKTADAR